MIIDTCEIIVDNYTCEIIVDNHTVKLSILLVAEKSIKYSILYNKNNKSI